MQTSFQVEMLDGNEIFIPFHTQMGSINYKLQCTVCNNTRFVISIDQSIISCSNPTCRAIPLSAKKLMTVGQGEIGWVID